MTTTALPTHTEIAIVGAGPTGLALAVTLASAGIEFVIVDQLAEGANTSRAAVVHARTLEVLDEFGAADALIARGDQVTRFAVRDGSRRLLTVPFDGLPTPYPYTLMVPQCDTEAVLLTRLRALGQDVHRPYQVSSVVQDEDGVTLTMSTGQILRAGYAVGADGMHSAVREAAGIGFTGSAYAESFVLADVTMDWTPGRDEVTLTFGSAGLTVVAPLPGGHYRIVATVDDAPATPDLAFVQRLLDERTPGLAQRHRPGLGIPVPGTPPGRRSLPGRPPVPRRRRRPRAQPGRWSRNEHRHPGRIRPRPGIRHPATRQDYETRRRPVAQRVVAFADRMTRIATTHNKAARRTRNIALPLLGHLPAFRTKMATELAELNYR